MDNESLKDSEYTSAPVGEPREAGVSDCKLYNSSTTQVYTTEDGRKLYRKRTRVPREIGVVIARLAAENYRTMHRDHMFEVATKVIAHILSGECVNGRCQAPISQELLRLMGGPCDTKGRNKFWAVFSPLFERTDYHFSPVAEERRARIICLTEWAQVAADRATEDYSSRSDFENLPKHGPKKRNPKNFSETKFRSTASDLGTIVPLTAKDIAVVRRLSAHPFFFDRVGALADPDVRKDANLLRRVRGMPHGVIFAQYKHARSGRLVTFELHLQGLDKRLRKYLRPLDDDRVFVYLDYKSHEPRLLAYVSGDTKLLRAVDDDIYSLLAQELGLTDTQGDTARNKAKRGLICLIYGGGANVIAQRLYSKKKNREIPQKLKPYFNRLACQVIEWFEATFPIAAKWMEDMIQRIIREGKAVTMLDQVERSQFDRDEAGQILRERDHSKKESFGGAKGAGLNHCLQGLGADMLRRLLVALEDELARYDAKVVLPNCDAVVIECPAAWSADVASLAKRLMEGLPMVWLPNATAVSEGRVLFPVEQAAWASSTEQHYEEDEEEQEEERTECI